MMNHLDNEKDYVLGKDFSLVVWGRAGGVVTITHKDGLESNSFTNYQLDRDIEIIFMQSIDAFKLRNYLLRYNQTEFTYEKLHNLEDFNFGSFNLTEFAKEYDLSGLIPEAEQLLLE